VILAFGQEQGSSVRAIAQVLLEYLKARPEAADTAEGISASWRGAARRVTRVAAVVEALEALVAHGTVTCETTPAGATVYRRRRPIS
jgi:hypothetical protein